MEGEYTNAVARAASAPRKTPVWAGARGDDAGELAAGASRRGLGEVALTGIDPALLVRYESVR